MSSFKYLIRLKGREIEGFGMLYTSCNCFLIPCGKFIFTSAVGAFNIHSIHFQWRTFTYLILFLYIYIYTFSHQVNVIFVLYYMKIVIIWLNEFKNASEIISLVWKLCDEFPFDVTYTDIHLKIRNNMLHFSRMF